MNIGHHQKGNVGQAHRRDAISDNNDDDHGYNKVEDDRNDADELEMGNGGEGNRDSENRQGGTNNIGKAIVKHTVKSGMRAIIVVAAVCMIPIWLTGGQDVVSVEKNNKEVPDFEVVEEWGCDNLPNDLRDVLEPHCIVHGKKAMSSISTMLPNLDFFRTVVSIFDSHARAEVWRMRRMNEIKRRGMLWSVDASSDVASQQLKERAGKLVEYVLVAGRGTTGSTSVTKWLGGDILQQQNLGSIHFHDARCPSHSSSTSECYHRFLLRGIKKIHSTLKKIRNKVSIEVKEGTYKQLFDDLGYYLGQPLKECGECMKTGGTNISSISTGTMPKCHNGFGGRVALLDSPLVSMFTELYFALGPETKVILLRRDKDEWAKSRAKNHGKSKVGIVCGDSNSTGYDARALHDPFSYTQCVSTALSVARNQQLMAINGTTEIFRAHIHDIGDIDKAYLSDAYDKYNLFVEKLVPNDYRLEVDLFSSKLLAGANGISARDSWTKLNQQLIKEFASC